MNYLLPVIRVQNFKKMDKYYLEVVGSIAIDNIADCFATSFADASWKAFDKAVHVWIETEAELTQQFFLSRKVESFP